jgi:transcriptional regulator with XRE-family HTH domain
MGDAGGEHGVGQLLRAWRERRRLTQLDLALDAGISARHLSFVETGRSKPGRRMLLAVAEQLEIPFRERNDLLLAAGHAPAFPQRDLADPDLEPVREALDRILAAHEPYPALVFDRAWNHVASNRPMADFAASLDVDPALLEPPVNVLRLGLHPRGMAPLVINLAHWHAHFLRRLDRQIALSGGDDLRALRDEVAAYPVPDEAGAAAAPAEGEMLGPVRLRTSDGGELAFLGMYAGFDTPFEVTSSELAIELLYPADRATLEALEEGSP